MENNFAIVVSSHRTSLPEDINNILQEYAHKHHLTLEVKPQILSPGHALEWCGAIQDIAELPALQQKGQLIFADYLLDFALVPLLNRRKKLLAADMDSTIITVECIDEMAEYLGIKEQIAAITERAMQGEMDFAQALRLRVKLLKGLTARDLQACHEDKITLTNGAIELLSVTKQNNAHAILLSGGFDFFVKRIAQQLAFDDWACNILDFDKDHRLSGDITEPVFDRTSKKIHFLAAMKQYNISPAQAIAVGDGANDLDMLSVCDMGIAFHAKPIVAAQARYQFDFTDLRGLLYLQGYADQKFYN